MENKLLEAQNNYAILIWKNQTIIVCNHDLKIIITLLHTDCCILNLLNKKNQVAVTEINSCNLKTFQNCDR